MNRLINCDCLEWLKKTKEKFTTVFADPPDNIGLKYNGFEDKIPNYYGWLEEVLRESLRVSNIVWLSFNSIHMVDIAIIVRKLGCIVKPCVQIFTFGQNRNTDLGSGYRPLWRLSSTKPILYPDQILVPSWRLLNGDKRADPKGRVPLDVFDFPRVTGNSKQRRSYHPTQLNEDLIRRCLLLSTKDGDNVLDIFSGTGTTLRVCKRINRQCVLIEKSKFYCDRILEEHKEIKSEVY